VLTKGGGRPWTIKERWECLSDHCAVAARVERSDVKRVTLRQTDWETVMEYLGREEELKKAGLGMEQHEYRYPQDGYKRLCTLLDEEWTRTIQVCTRAKRWWKREWKHLRRSARKETKARAEFRSEIRKTKAECWGNWVEEGKGVWDILRVAKNPFNRRVRLETEERTSVDEADHEGKAAGFISHNIISGPEHPPPPQSRREREMPSKKTMDSILRALGKTKSSSATGPDGVSWRLLKALKDTHLGRAVLEDVGEWRQMEMVRIPKPGKVVGKVKGGGR